MTLSRGEKLGPYEVVAALGAGGMGEVYRARDTKLDRDVAVKVLPERIATDPEALARFEREAKAVAALSHPNILAIHDFGNQGGTAYAVMELLEGETLRDRLKPGALPFRKAVEYAGQIAQGLAAAHEKGIVHRDLKPENLFVTRDGRVKILDFGLARHTPAKTSDNEISSPTVTRQTEPGTVLGTVGYMSPEQVKGRPADHRSDIFSLGCVLYEMLSGRRAFHRDTAAETMTAILNEDPPAVTDVIQPLPPALERIVRHCLEKSPEERFQSARDLAFDLSTLSGVSEPSPARGESATPLSQRKLHRLLVLATGAALIVAAFLVGRRTERANARLAEAASATPPSFQRLAFRRGTIESARFAPDGHTIVYGAAWDGKPVEVFSTRRESRESRSLGLPGAEILALSPLGEMALSLRRKRIQLFESAGTLARAPLAGGAPREILEDVVLADWAPDGGSPAVVRRVAGRGRLEWPVGKVLYETAGWIGNARVSPKGNLIAFLDHPSPNFALGSVVIVDLGGKRTTLSGDWLRAQGLAWSPSGEEVWFTATKVGYGRALHAVTLSGRDRLVTRVAGPLTLHDIAPDGTVLIAHENARREMRGLASGETKERDLSWLDYSLPRGISADGRTVLFHESGEGGGATFGVYLRKMDGSDAVRLGAGRALALSPDGRWVLSQTPSISGFLLLPTGPGEPKPLPQPRGIAYLGFGAWFPDGRRILFHAEEPGHGARCYVQDVERGSPPRAVTPEGIDINPTENPISPDGRFVALPGSDQTLSLYPVEGGEPRPVRGALRGDHVVCWNADGLSLWVNSLTEVPARIYRLDLASGTRRLWKELVPADPVGVASIDQIRLTPDGRAYVYAYIRTLSDLYLVEGLK